MFVLFYPLPWFRGFPVFVYIPPQRRYISYRVSPYVSERMIMKVELVLEIDIYAGVVLAGR